MGLNELMVKYGTDKQKDVHNYVQFYEKYFTPIKEEKLKILEIGIYRPPVGGKASVGASLKTWGDYFINSEIYGVDLDSFTDVDDSRIKTIMANQEFRYKNNDINGLNDVYLAYLTGFKKINDLQTVGFGLRYFSLGSIQFTDPNGTPLNTGRPNEFELSGAYARKLSEKLSAAVTGKFIYSNLAAGNIVNGEVIEPGIAGAADFSMTYKTPIKVSKGESDLTIGLAITNIGSKITYTNSLFRDFLPANFGLGGAWTFNFDTHNSLTFTTDINKMLVPTPCQGLDCDQDRDGRADYKDVSPVSAIFSSWADAPEGLSEEIKEFTYSVGTEYWYDKQFAVRAGYFSEHRQKGNRKFFTVGLGLKYNLFGLNFSYLVPTTSRRNPLDNTLRFSMLFNFNGNTAE